MNLSLWMLIAFSFSFVWNTDPIDPNIKASETEIQWVDSVYESMSEEERLGQLFMIRAHSDKGPDHITKVKNLIKKYKVGSLCFFQGTPEKQIDKETQKCQLKTSLLSRQLVPLNYSSRLRLLLSKRISSAH